MAATVIIVGRHDDNWLTVSGDPIDVGRCSTRWSSIVAHTNCTRTKVTTMSALPTPSRASLLLFVAGFGTVLGHDFIGGTCTFIKQATCFVQRQELSRKIPSMKPEL